MPKHARAFTKGDITDNLKIDASPYKELEECLLNSKLQSVQTNEKILSVIHDAL